MLRRRAYARAGLMGNPSDGYHGKTVSILVRDYFAEVVLYEWDDVEIVLAEEDRVRFGSVEELAYDVDLHGYYGGIRLVKATIKTFVEYCRGRHTLHDRNFSIRYQTNIPRAVGLAGSSAIIVATMHALIDFYKVSVPKDLLPSIVLSVETEQLGIAAGLQDRVAQVYGGLVFMDFSRNRMVQKQGFWCGVYESLDPSLLPPLYIAFSETAGEPTEVLHNCLRTRYEQKEPAVVNAMDTFAELAQQTRDALLDGHRDLVISMIDRNFDLRQSICHLPEDHVRMVQTARAVGASAKFAGSGGAIIGTYESEATFQNLCQELGAMGCQVIRANVG